jgi:hypothetical protein
MQPLAVSVPAVDRPVFVCDVMPFARKSCERCHGTGVVTRVMHAGAQGESRNIDACACATKRFKKKCGNDVAMLNGQVHWKPGKAPVIVEAPPAQRTDAQPPVQDPA